MQVKLNKGLEVTLQFEPLLGLTSLIVLQLEHAQKKLHMHIYREKRNCSAIEGLESYL